MGSGSKSEQASAAWVRVEYTDESTRTCAHGQGVPGPGWSGNRVLTWSRSDGMRQWRVVELACDRGPSTRSTGDSDCSESASGELWYYRARTGSLGGPSVA